MVRSIRNNDNTWENIDKDKPIFLKLEINASVIVNVIDYTRGCSPERAELEGLDPEVHVTEVNKYGKYPHIFKIKIKETGGMFQNNIDLEGPPKIYTWSSLCGDSYELLDRLDRGNIPDHKEYGSNVCKIIRVSDREHKIKIPSAVDQNYKPNEMDDGD